MNKSIREKFAELAHRAELLPEEAQEALLRDIEQRVDDFATPLMSATQKTEVKRRLALPRRTVPEDEIRTILRRYNTNL